MNQTTYTIGEIQSVLIPIFDQYQIRSAILFGSYAKGDAQEKSDIDLLVDSGLKGLAFFGLLEDVVNALGKDVDLLDTSQVVPYSEVDNEITKTGVLIYSCS
jgi:predicted nucleotidyltransferase